MLDENLPTFFLKPAADGTRHIRSLYLGQHGQDPEPAYIVKGADPATDQGRNCYALALFDSFSTDILYGEIFVQPSWGQAQESQGGRKNSNPAPPQLEAPTDFTVHLYNPDQDVVVHQKPGSWGGSSSYEFSMPMSTFRLPSASDLDRSHADPTTDTLTPRIKFTWRRDNRMSKDMTCYMAGKTTDTKKKSKEPDIPIGLFRSLRELTIYEPNLSRVEMEDFKGLEVVLLLSALGIRDLQFSSLRETFNIVEGAPAGRPAQLTKLQTGAAVAQPGQAARPNASATPSSATRPGPGSSIDQETARLRAQQEAEARATEARRKEIEKQDELEARRMAKQFEKEEKDRRKRAAEVDRETERLRREYGDQQGMLPSSSQGQPQQQPQPQPPYSAPPANNYIAPPPGASAYPHNPYQSGGYMQPPMPGPNPSYGYPGGAAPPIPPRNNVNNSLAPPGPATAGGKKPQQRRSFWNLVSGSDGSTREAADDSNRLTKKGSSIF